MELGRVNKSVLSPIGRLSKCTANGARVLLATVTFQGERVDITGPDAAVLVADRRGSAHVLSASSRTFSNRRRLSPLQCLPANATHLRLLTLTRELAVCDGPRLSAGDHYCQRCVVFPWCVGEALVG
jgi:hypothetical protein